MTPLDLLATAAPEGGVLFDLVKLFALALVVTLLCDRFRVPTILGLLVTGVIAGPNALALVAEPESVESMAEIGIILLLFTIGLEFSIDSLMRIRIPFFLGGTLQHLMTGIPVGIVCYFLGLSWQVAVLLGMVAIQSSTAVAVKMLQERGEIDSPPGRLSVAMLLFQDFLSVAFVLLIPLLVANSGEGAAFTRFDLGKTTLKIVGVGGLLWIGARYLVPWVLFRVAAMRDREVFLLSVIVIGFGIAAITSSAGLSLALGAFLAGIIISESEYGHRALGSILPFKEVFISLFFISIGMLLDPRMVLASPGTIGLIMVAIMAFKFAMVVMAVLILRYPLRVAFQTGILTAAVGEFGFILARAGLDAGVIGDDVFQLFLAVSISSLMVGPFLITAGPWLADRLGIQANDRSAFAKGESEALGECALSDHLIIIGFGPVGRYSARAAGAASIPYLVIEMNPQTVKEERAAGEPIFYGDAGQQMVLEASGIERARAILIVIADPAAARRIVQLARSLNPTLKIIVRIRFQSEIQPLVDLGADEVVPEELETAIELLSRVLKTYLVPIDKIDATMREARASGYQMLREKNIDVAQLRGVQNYLGDIDVSVIRLKDRPTMVGHSLADLALRSVHGITVVAIRREGITILNPDPLEQLQANDELIAVGQPQKLSTITRKISGGELIPLTRE